MAVNHVEYHMMPTKTRTLESLLPVPENLHWLRDKTYKGEIKLTWAHSRGPWPDQIQAVGTQACAVGKPREGRQVSSRPQGARALLTPQSWLPGVRLICCCYPSK